MTIERTASNHLATQIKRLRLDRAWSEQDLADRCYAAGSRTLTRSTLAKIESKTRKRVTVDEQLILAQVFELPLDTLMGTDPAPHSASGR